MANEKQDWFSVNPVKEENYICVACGSLVELEYAWLNHRSGSCFKCGINCIWWSRDKEKIQIIPEKAPMPLRKVIVWVQENFDELEFVEFVGSLEQIADEVQNARKNNI